MVSPVRQILDLISSSLSTLENNCAAKNLPLPDLHTPFHPASEAFRADPEAAEAANVIVAAALQLAAILAPPHISLYHIVGGHFYSAAIRVCLESNVTEILREGGPEGVHINEIGAKNGQDPHKIGRFLRALATHHIYREISPNVFTNTRISSMLDTLKPSQEIIANPEQKHDNTPGLAALASHHLDEGFKSSAYAWETLADPATANSEETNEAPFNRAFDTKDTAWEYFQRPDQEFRQRRFGIGMRGVEALQDSNAFLNAFDWKGLPKGSTVVDVGGGVGTCSLPIAREFPDLQIVLQDRPSVIEEASKVWSKELPDALNSGRAKLEAQDFFAPQPKREVSVFFLKHILHDWPAKYCTKILKALWEAANANTKLVLMESIIRFASPDDGGAGEVRKIPGASELKEAPPPLLANYGLASSMGYIADIGMFLFFNSQERTIGEMDDLLRTGGWQLTNVRRPEGRDSNFLQSLEAVPIGK